ncbi:hypothetical protein E5CHR_03861 [Variovorax sp. PBL-E5]|nr:hypothetical protein E5CHR_03861 [Variovorax sp. PBL-E5]
MSSRNLRIAGPDSSPYELGQPLSVYDGARHLGTVTTVILSKDGGTLHLGGFVSSPIPQQRMLRRLVVVEITAFVVDRFPGVRTIGYTLGHRVEGLRDGLALASVRASLLRSMGGEQIRISPKLGARDGGHFVVQCVWHRSPQALDALARTLTQAREARQRQEAAFGASPLSRLRALIGRFL